MRYYIGPDYNSRKPDDTQYASKHKALYYFTTHYPPPVGKGYFTYSHGLYDERGSLRAGIAPARNNEWNKQCQHHCFLNFIFKISHGRSREHFTKEQDNEPSHSFSK